MKRNTYEARYYNRTFLIVESTPEIGTYLYIFEQSDFGATDYLQNSVDDCKRFAFKYFQVPMDMWTYSGKSPDDHNFFKRPGDFDSDRIEKTREQPKASIEQHMIMNLNRNNVKYHITRTELLRIDIDNYPKTTLRNDTDGNWKIEVEGFTTPSSLSSTTNGELLADIAVEISKMNLINEKMGPDTNLDINIVGTEYLFKASSSKVSF